MELVVTDCEVRGNQWTVKFDVIGADGSSEPAIAILSAPDTVSEDDVLKAAAAQVREATPLWDGVRRSGERKSAVGRRFDVTRTSIKEVNKEKAL